MSESILITVMILSFLMSFSIGSNDAANALGTSYGSNAARLWILLILGAIFEFVGAVWCSSKLAGTLPLKLIPSLGDLSVDVQERMMLGVCISSFSFILFSSLFGMPISGTHTVIGALIGAGIAGVGFNGIGWHALVKVVLSWFISPVLASALCGIIFISICFLTQGGYVMSTRPRLILLTLISAFSVAFMTWMCINVAAKKNPNPQIFYSLIGAFIFGVFACRFILVMTESKMAKFPLSKCEIAISTLSFWSYESLVTICERSFICSDSMIQQQDNSPQVTRSTVGEVN